MDNIEARGTNLASIIAHNLENYKNNVPGIFDEINTNDDMKLDVDTENLRTKDIMDWDSKEKENILFYLLNKVKSMISKKNLTMNINDPRTINI